jgi:uncharacterized membrane protein YbhN (UPF0104 family)
MKNRLLFVGKLAVSLSLLLYLVSIVDIRAMLSRFANIEIGFLVIAFFVSITCVSLSALKWKLILSCDGVDRSYPFLWRLYYIGNFFSLFLPSSIGGDVYRVYAVSAEDKKYAKTTSSVLFDRISGLFALLSISLFGYLSLPGRRYDYLLLAIYALGIASFYFCTSELCINAFRKLDKKIVRHISTLLLSFRSYRLDSLQLAKILGIAFFFQFLIVLNVKLYTLALSIDIPMSQLIVIVPLIFLTEVLPISINGAGVRDSAFVFFFVMIGHTKEEGLAVGLLLIIMRYIGGLVGGSVLVATVLQKHLATKTTET